MVTPMDVVKTRLQSVRVGTGIQYSGIADTYRRIVTDEGVSALFRGSIPRACVVGPLFGLAIASYDICSFVYLRYII